jgi:hypothetical protein
MGVIWKKYILQGLLKHFGLVVNGNKIENWAWISISIKFKPSGVI